MPIDPIFSDRTERDGTRAAHIHFVLLIPFHWAFWFNINSG